MQPRRSREQQAFAFQLRAGSHLHKARQMQINGPRSDAAAPGQHGLCPAQPGQQRGAEQDGCPHPARRACRQRPTAGHPVHPHIRPLPLRCAACTAQQGKALGHIGQLRHPAQPHWPAAQQGRCQQRQHTVLGRRDPYRSIQRPPARDDVIPCHAKTPVLPKIPHGMQNEGRRFPVLYPDTAKRICPVVCLFFASFAGQTSHFAAEMAAFMFPRGRRTARCPSRPAASSGWCRRRKRRAG